MHGPNNFAFIDGVNLHLTYESESFEWKLDYKKLRDFLKEKFNVIIAHYFLGKNRENVDLYRTLESYGYNLKLKEPSPHVTKEEYCPHCGKMTKPQLKRNKADCDSFMTLTVISELHLYDKAVIMTSDGDFDELVKKLRRQDKLRMVFAPCRDGCSELLRNAAVEKIAFVDDYRDVLEKI